ncbi:fascin domain-containing protein [Clostridium pasteurianum]|nr:glycoside hydrolase [Clostridium pasteurianum]
MFKDTRKSNKEQQKAYNGPDFDEEDTIVSHREDTIISDREKNTGIFYKDYSEADNNRYNNSTEEQEEAVYSPLIDKLIGICEYVEGIYIKQLKKKKIISDTKNINREKRKYYNRIIYSPINGKIYNSYYNYVFMNLLLVLVITLIFTVLFTSELKFPFKLLSIIPAAVFFLYLCKLYNYLSPFISRIKVLRRHLIYINKENFKDPVISPVEGIISSLKEDENSIEIKTAFGIRLFISMKYIKSIEMLVKEGDKITLGEELFKFTVEGETNPVMFFYIGSNRSYKIKSIKQMNFEIIQQNDALFLAECSIYEASPILRDGEVISLSSYVYGDNEYSSKIVTVNGTNGQALMENSNAMGKEERFLVVGSKDGTVSLKSLKNTAYVGVNLSEKGKLSANSFEINNAEKFIFIWQEQGAYVIIALANNKVVSADINAEGTLMANHDYIGAAERFYIWKH